MYSFIPNKNKNKIIITETIYISLAVFCLIFSLQVKIYQWLFQLSAILFFVLFAEIASRFSIPIYTYIINKNDIIMTKKQNNRETKLCCIEITDKAKILSKEDYLKEKNILNKDIIRTFNYCQNIFSKSPCYLIFEFKNKFGLIIFEPNDEMVRLINEIIKTNSYN